MPWQGNKETIIDRFDVRAHLEYIPEAARPTAGSSEPVNLDGDVDSIGELNYERYRILIQNEFTNGMNPFCRIGLNNIILPSTISYIPGTGSTSYQLPLLR